MCFRKLRLQRFSDSTQLKVVRLSALRTVRLDPQGRYLVLISVRVCVHPRATVRPEGLVNEKFQ